MYAQKGKFWKKNSSLTILLYFLGFISPHFSYLLVFTLNFNKHGCNGGEEEKTYLLLGLYMFLYMLVKHVMDIQAMNLQG